MKAKPKLKQRSKSELEPKTKSGRAAGRCLCGAVSFEIDTPAFWAWHDHTQASRIAHGAAYATYVGCWRTKFRIVKGKSRIARYEDAATASARSFCRNCGTPLLYERGTSPRMVDIPRALFAGRTGREPRYHVGIAELQDWTFLGGRLVPLKGYPGTVWERSRRKKRLDTFRP